MDHLRGAESTAAASRLTWQDLAGRETPVLSGDARDVLVLFFVSPECPVANRSAPTMRALAAEFGRDRTTFFAVYPDPDATRDALRRHAEEYGLNFNLRRDAAHRVVEHVAVTFTPEAVIMDGTGSLIYRGRIDDRFVDFGQARPRANREDVREVLLALRAGRRPTFREQRGFGCTIQRTVNK